MRLDLRSSLLALTLLAPTLLAPFGCGDDSTAASDSGDTQLPDSSETNDTQADLSDTENLDIRDTGPDAPVGDEVYGPRPLPAGPLAEPLEGEGWASHWEDDIAPFWTSPEALGSPVGNYPTFRGMDGRVLSQTRRRPRMISRQIYAYSAGYLLTGDPALLAHAKAGVDWLRAHAIDRVKGGCHEQLEADGSPVAGVRTAQDLSYCVMGLAAWYFVTRDPQAEADLLAAHRWLFDQNRYWDRDKARIRDALADDMRTAVDVENDGGAELVAQLDPINAFMLLVQPVLSEAADRATFLEDMERLAKAMRLDFYQDGMFWGVDTKRGQYGSKHADFGHNLKSFWMLLELDKRLPDHPYHDFLLDPEDGAIHAALTRAYDAENGRWAKRPNSPTSVEYGSDWWIYAELDQLAATLDLIDHRYLELRAKTQAHWLSDYVDKRFPGEVIPGIKRDGSPAWSWSASDDAKCNLWKNGFHSSEHALVLYILGQALDGDPVTLHFAFEDPDAPARPYLFHGRELDRSEGTPLTVGARTLTPVTVRFTDLW